MRNSNGDEVGPLARFDAAVILSTPERVSPVDRRALYDPGGRQAWSEPADSGHLGEQVQILDAGKAVGADRDAHTRGIETVDGRRPGASPAVAARTGHQGRA